MTQFKPVVYKRYVDDTFLLFRSKEHVEKQEQKKKKIAFISEIEQDGSLPFPDIKINRENIKICDFSLPKAYI